MDADPHFDSLLSELQALEDQLSSASRPRSRPSNEPGPSNNQRNVPNLLTVPVDRSGRSSIRNSTGEGVPRASSPDDDSAFCDSGSFTSNESVLSGVARGRQRCRNFQLNPDLAGDARSDRLESQPSCNSVLSDEQRKAEKIRMALVLMQEARIRKLPIKFVGKDGDSRTLEVDERWTAGRVLRLLAVEFGSPFCVNFALVERCPDLQLERMLEDHELILENVLFWMPHSNNSLHFLERTDKYGLFNDPQTYLLRENGVSGTSKNMDAADKHRLITEFFSAPQIRLPEMTGMLFIKSDGKKSWKNFYCSLRPSGLYFCPRGKSKSLKDLACMCRVETVVIYSGIDWRKKYKAPTDFGFALKHPKIQAKASKYIKYFCADNEETLNIWLASFRLAKYGKQLYENFAECCQHLPAESLDKLRASDSSTCTFPADDNFYSISPTPSVPIKSLVTHPQSPTAPFFGLPAVGDHDFSAEGTIKRRPVSSLHNSLAADALSLCSNALSTTGADARSESTDDAEPDSDEERPSTDSPVTIFRQPRKIPPAPPKRAECTRLSASACSPVELQPTIDEPPTLTVFNRPKPPVPAKPTFLLARSELQLALQRRLDRFSDAPTEP